MRQTGKAVRLLYVISQIIERTMKEAFTPHYSGVSRLHAGLQSILTE
jgi:hypothetical protein